MRLQFSLKTVFISTTFIAAGAGMLAYLFLPRPGHVHAPLNTFQMVLWFAAGAAIGAGLLLPLKRPIAGASLGLIVQSIGWLSMDIIWN